MNDDPFSSILAKTKQYKKGDIIELDCGYNGMIDMQPCKLLGNPIYCKALFENDKPELTALVQICGSGETFRARLTQF